MSVEWMLIRGSGLVAYGLLAAAAIWGLLIATKVLGRLVKAKSLTWFHEALGLAAVLATGLHMVGLGLDDYIDFGWRELLVPGASAWNPLGVAFGVMGFYAVVVVTFSFYVKQFIGQAAWRAIHFLSFGTFVAVTLHGVLAGTDRGHPAVVAMYASSGAIVGLLLVIRIVQATGPAPAARRTEGRVPDSQTVERLPAVGNDNGSGGRDMELVRPAPRSRSA